MAWLKGRLADRSGLTLIEILFALGIFLLGAVGITGLFVTASAMHKDAVERRTAAYIAEEMLSEIRGAPFRTMFAVTRLDGDLGETDGEIWVDSTEANAAHPGAAFNLWPIWAGAGLERSVGPLLVGREWMWHTDLDDARFTGVARGVWGTEQLSHEAGAPVLQPRTWVFVLEEDLEAPGEPDEETYLVARGDPDPIEAFQPPPSGYIMLNEEWIRYSSVEPNGSLWTFEWDDSERDRGMGHSIATAHRAGAPIAFGWEHSDYAGFYYTFQVYPINARGTQAKVVVSVAHGTPTRLRRAHFFRTIYSATSF